MWSLLFFLMVITVGLDSMFGMVETLATAINDALRLHGKNPRYKMLVTLAVCVVGFLCGLSMVTRGGILMLDMIDGTVTRWLVPVAFIEVRSLKLEIWNSKTTVHRLQGGGPSGHLLDSVDLDLSKEYI